MIGALARVVMPGHDIRFLSFFLVVVIVSQIHMRINSQICRMGLFRTKSPAKRQKTMQFCMAEFRGG